MSLKKLLLTGALVAAGSWAGSQADGYDTLFCRGDSMIIVAKYDTVKQLEKANLKADKILSDLQEIAKELGINDTLR